MKETGSRKISAIVPFYNEEKTLYQVTKVLLESSLFDEVILVNDGSTDNSIGTVKQFSDRVILINNNKNKGKGAAVAEGIKASSNQILLFVDADLMNISKKHLELLLEPVLSDKFRCSIGYPLDNIYDYFFKSYGGQRCYHKSDLLGHLDELSQSRYGLEVLLNNLFEKKDTKGVPLKNLGHLMKPVKRNESEFIKEFITWVMDVGKQLFKLKMIDVKEYGLLMKAADIKTPGELEKFTRRLKSGNLKKHLFRYLGRFIKEFNSLTHKTK